MMWGAKGTPTMGCAAPANGAKYKRSAGNVCREDEERGSRHPVGNADPHGGRKAVVSFKVVANIEDGKGRALYAATPGKKEIRLRASNVEALEMLEQKEIDCRAGTETIESDKKKVAHGFQKGLEGIDKEDGRQAISRICAKYETQSATAMMRFGVCPIGGNEQEERVRVMMQGALNRHWGRVKPNELCWTLGTWNAALAAMTCYINARAETEEHLRDVVIASPYLTEACVDEDSGSIDRMWERLVARGIDNAVKVVLPCLQKTKEEKGVGHFFILVITASEGEGHVAVVDSRYSIKDDTAKLRGFQFARQVIEKMEARWGISRASWTFGGQGQVTQCDGTTCGPRSMLNALAEMTEGRDKERMLTWHESIKTVEDFILHQMHSSGKVMQQQSEGVGGEVWHRGTKVKEGPQYTYGGASKGNSPEDAIDVEARQIAGREVVRGDVTDNETQEEGEVGKTRIATRTAKEEGQCNAPKKEGHRHGDGGHVK